MVSSFASENKFECDSPKSISPIFQF